MNKVNFDLIIEPGRVESQYWRDLWRYRELFIFLAWRDALVRYKQTLIGIAWSVLRPLLTMLAFVLVFNKVARLEAGSTPYPILVYAAILPWQLFANALSESSNSLVANSNLISKVYFPRMIIPVSSIIVCLIDFFLSSLIFLLVLLFFTYAPGGKVIFLPLFLLLTFLISTGAGLWLAAVTVKYRDFRFVVPFLIQFGVYVSPVGFSSEIVPENWRLLYSVNPMVGVIDGFRWCLLNDSPPLYMPALYFSTGFALLLLAFGIRYFRETEKTFADRI